MSKCGYTFCNNEVSKMPGKRARIFCSDTCRQKQWQIEKRNKTQAPIILNRAIMPGDVEKDRQIAALVKEVNILKKRVAELEPYETAYRIRQSATFDYADVPETGLQDATKPNKAVKNLSEEKPVTNYTVDTRPKTLQELKEMCPPELVGLEKSMWIATERGKYGL